MILFAIDCSESMLELHDDPNYEDVKTSHVLTALEAAMQISKKKVLIGPNDAVGIMLFNTVGNLLGALHISAIDLCRRLERMRPEDQALTLRNTPLFSSR